MKRDKRQYMREYNKKPEVKAKMREYYRKPEVKAKAREKATRRALEHARKYLSEKTAQAYVFDGILLHEREKELMRRSVK